MFFEVGGCGSHEPSSPVWPWDGQVSLPLKCSPLSQVAHAHHHVWLAGPQDIGRSGVVLDDPSSQWRHGLLARALRIAEHQLWVTWRTERTDQAWLLDLFCLSEILTCGMVGDVALACKLVNQSASCNLRKGFCAHD